MTQQATELKRDIFSLDGRVALITGGSRGIGRSIAEEYARRGARVVITARKAEELEETAGALRADGAEVLAIPGHVGRESEVDAVLDQVLDRFGRLDVLVNNAATNVAFGPFKDLDVAAFDKTLEINLRAPFVISQKVVNRAMEKQGGGCIINMCSVASLRADPMATAYNVSKAGLLMLTRVMAKELGPLGIRVNAIAPGLIRTKFSRVLYETDSIRESFEKGSALGRIGEWDEVAGAAVYLASDAAGFVTGSVITVDGGTLA